LDRDGQRALRQDHRIGDGTVATFDQHLLFAVGIKDNQIGARVHPRRIADFRPAAIFLTAKARRPTPASSKSVQHREHIPRQARPVLWMRKRSRFAHGQRAPISKAIEIALSPVARRISSADFSSGIRLRAQLTRLTPSRAIAKAATTAR
jgi:hypothetical protein